MIRRSSPTIRAGCRSDLMSPHPVRRERVAVDGHLKDVNSDAHYGTPP